jgi:hypothetical protein
MPFESKDNLQDHVGQTVTAKEFYFINSAGGTGGSNWQWDDKYSGAPAELIINRIWFDYETGVRMVANPAPDQPELIAYLDRNAFKGKRADNLGDGLVPGDTHEIFVSEFDLL